MSGREDCEGEDGDGCELRRLGGMSALTHSRARMCCRELPAMTDSFNRDSDAPPGRIMHTHV